MYIYNLYTVYIYTHIQYVYIYIYLYLPFTLAMLMKHLIEHRAPLRLRVAI